MAFVFPDPWGMEQIFSKYPNTDSGSKPASLTASIYPPNDKSRRAVLTLRFSIC
jgi:hypothetical protein